MAERAFAWGVLNLGFKEWYRDPYLAPGLAAIRDVAAYLKGRNIVQPYAVVAPGAGTIYKAWPEPLYWDLCRRIKRTLGIPVVVVLGPQETGRGMVAPADACDFCCRDWEITDVAAVFARAAFYVGNDSGLSHVAVWVCPDGPQPIPCILPFCRLNIRAWAATRDWVDIIPLPCSTPYDVTVDDVLAHCAARFRG